MLTATIEKSIGARRRRTSRIWMSAQLSFPPDNPTITRSPSSIKWYSVIAFVTCFARRASRSVAYGIRSFVFEAVAQPFTKDLRYDRYALRPLLYREQLIHR